MESPARSGGRLDRLDLDLAEPPSVSGYLKNNQLRRQLEEKVREATQARQAAEEAITAAREIVESARKIDADVPSARDALAAADAAMGGKDYKLAGDKAREALDLGTTILRDRVEGMIRSSESLLGLAKGVGGAQDDAEAVLKKAREALAADELNAAVEHAKKAWKRAEKTLHEHLSSSFSRAQALILSAKNLKRDVALVEDLLARARAAMEANDYDAAVEFTKEALDTVTEDLRADVDREMGEAEELTVTARDLGVETTRLTSLIERARGDIANFDFEKARNTLRQCRTESEKALRLGVEGKTAAFTKILEETRGLGADPSAAEEHFQAAEVAVKKGAYREAAEAAQEGLKVLQDILFQTVVQTIAASREKFVIATTVGADLSTAMGHLSRARQDLQRNAYREAIESARKADAEVDKAIGAYRAAETRLRELHRAFAEADARGMDTGPARQLADQARKAYQERNPEGLERLIQAAFDILRKSEHEHAMRFVERAEAVLSLGERTGANLTEASRLLEKAILAAKSEDYRNALDLAGQAMSGAQAALGKRIGETITALRDVLPQLGEETASIKVLLNRADASMSNGDFEEAFGSIDEARRAAEGRMKSIAQEGIDDLGTVVQMGVDLGADVAAVDALYKEMNALLGSGRYLDVLGSRDRIRTSVAGAADTVFNLVKNRVAQARELKIDIEEMRDLLKRSKMAFSVENPHDGLLLMKECADRAGKATAVHRQTQKALASAAAFAAEARKRDVDVTKVLEILLEGKRAFERFDYQAATDLAGKARAETEKLMVIYTSAQKILSSRERLDLATRVGIATTHLAEALGEAKEAMKAKDYARAVARATSVEAEITDLLRERLSAMIAEAEASSRTIPAPSFASLSDDLAQAKTSLDTTQFVVAVDAVLRLQGAMERLQRQAQEADGAMRRVRDLLVDIRSMDLEVPAADSLLGKAERAFKAAQFEETLDVAAQAEAEAARERDQGIQALVDRFQAAVDRARREGTDTRPAESLLQQSRDFLRGKKYRQAIALAMQSESEAERLGLQQRMAAQALQSVERKLGGLGYPALSVARALDDVRKAFGAGDYVKALDGSVRAMDALAGVQTEIDDVQRTRERVLTLIAAAQGMGAESVKLSKIFDEGEAALRGGDLPRARSAYAQSLEWGTGLIRAHVKEFLGKAEADVATCKRIALDPTSALNKVAQGKARLEAGDFSEAFGLLKEGRRLAQAALGERLNESFLQAADNLSHARKIGSESPEAEDILRQARERLDRQEYEGALELTERALERAESAKVVEKRFVDLTYKAESTIRNGKKFGIDMRGAENRLAHSMDLRRSSLPAAIKEAEEAYRLAWEAVETFAPKLQGSLEIGPAQLNEWVEATLTLQNTGRGLAKDVSVKILGDAETEGLRDLPAVRAGGKDALRVRIRMTASGSVPLAIQITSHRVFDDKAYTQEMIAQVEVGETIDRPKNLVADLETRCPICKGMIKKGFRVLRCACGRDFHELCGTRVGRCPVCFRPLGPGSG